MDFKPLTLEDKERFERYTAGLAQSEASFANLYIWQHQSDTEIADADGALFVRFHDAQGRPYMLPPFVPDSSQSMEPYMRAAEEYMLQQFGTFHMKCATADTVRRISWDCPGRYVFPYDPNNSDYVYKTSDLADLPGKRYHGKRNHVSAFLRSHNPALVAYSNAYRDACLLMQDEWARTGQDDPVVADEEYISILKALDNHAELGLKGMVVMLDDKVAGFTFGEQLNKDTALIHIEKANRDVNGLFTYINQSFVDNYWRDTRYINREEDMGIPGLRKAKRSYHPDHMVEKYDVLLGEK